MANLKKTALRKRIIALRKKGKTHQAIANLLGLKSRQLVSYYLRTS